MHNDTGQLVAFTKRYLEFKKIVEGQFSYSINQVDTEELLENLRAHVAEIKEVYLLLIAYETVLREILEKYEEWRQYLETIEEIAFLSQEELSGIRRLKELNFHLRTSVTL